MRPLNDAVCDYYCKAHNTLFVQCFLRICQLNKILYGWTIKAHISSSSSNRFELNFVEHRARSDSPPIRRWLGHVLFNNKHKILVHFFYLAKYWHTYDDRDDDDDEDDDDDYQRNSIALTHTHLHPKQWNHTCFYFYFVLLSLFFCHFAAVLSLVGCILCVCVFHLISF